MADNHAFSLLESPEEKTTNQVAITIDGSSPESSCGADTLEPAILFAKTLKLCEERKTEKKSPNKNAATNSKGVFRSRSLNQKDAEVLAPRLVLSATGVTRTPHTEFTRSASDMTAQRLKDTNSLTSQVASFFYRRSARLSAKSERKHQAEILKITDVEVEYTVFGKRTPISQSEFLQPSAEEELFISAEQMQNIFAEKRDRLLIVDCREDSESSRMDMSYWNTCSIADLTEADSLQIDRINKSNDYIILVSNLLKDERQENGNIQLLNHLKNVVEHFLSNSNSMLTDIRILDCALNDILYLGGNESIPLVADTFIYLLKDINFQYSAEGLYNTVITDSRGVEKFCHEISNCKCYMLTTLLEDLPPVIYLLDKARLSSSCVLICCNDIENIAISIVLSYIMWFYSHSLTDAIRRLQHDKISFHLKHNTLKDLQAFEEKLYGTSSSLSTPSCEEST